ncbi:recombinase family protein [Kribbella sp. NPDC051137]|uniref:recombinase family protein n=1 Tax=Kribbella sp. NPDC051137 TaxID=3155045 RepID=UPI0034289093
MTQYVALCCRISRDKSGRTEGVQAQERWGREYAAATWPGVPVEVFADGNNSAMNPDGPRPEHDRFKEWLAAGRIAHVWAVEQSRLERDELRWFGLAAELDAAGITHLHTKRDGLVDVRGEVAGIKAVLNAGEVRKMRRRLMDTLADKAGRGLPPGGAHACYRGAKTPDGEKTLEPIPDRAEAYAWAADAVLSGWSMANITTELRARGVTGTRGGELGASSVRSTLLSPTIAGKRVHQGATVRGNWPPVLDEPTWRAVTAKLTADRVVQRSDGEAHLVRGRRRNHPGRKYLLTGGDPCLVVCGVCGCDLIGAPKVHRNGTSKPHLLCAVVKGGRACVSVAMDRVDELVMDRLWAELDKPEFLHALAVDEYAERRDALVKQLGDLEQQRTELAKMWTRRHLTAAEWSTARADLADQERELSGELANLPAPRARVDVAEAREAWPYMTLDERRDFVRLFIERVTIHRAAPETKHTFDPNRVSIAWRVL